MSLAYSFPSVQSLPPQSFSRGWTKVPNAILDRADLSALDIMAWQAVKSHCFGSDGECVHSDRVIAVRAHMARQTFVKHRQRLESFGLIRSRTEAGPWGVVRYLKAVSPPDVGPPVIPIDRGCRTDGHPPVTQRDSNLIQCVKTSNPGEQFASARPPAPAREETPGISGTPETPTQTTPAPEIPQSLRNLMARVNHPAEANCPPTPLIPPPPPAPTEEHAAMSLPEFRRPTRAEVEIPDSEIETDGVAVPLTSYTPARAVPEPWEGPESIPTPPPSSEPSGAVFAPATVPFARPSEPPPSRRAQMAAAVPEFPGAVEPDEAEIGRAIRKLDEWFPLLPYREAIISQICRHRRIFPSSWFVRVLKRLHVEGRHVRPGWPLIFAILRQWEDSGGPNRGPEDEYDDDLRLIPRSQRTAANGFRPRPAPSVSGLAPPPKIEVTEQHRQRYAGHVYSKPPDQGGVE